VEIVKKLSSLIPTPMECPEVEISCYHTHHELAVDDNVVCDEEIVV